MNRKQKIKQLRRLFPSAFDSTGMVIWEELVALLGGQADIDNESNDEDWTKFEWIGRRNAIAKAAAAPCGALEYVPELSIDPDNTRNLLAEGDNYDALRLLREEYSEAVQMIYIDPPYNTGKEFTYTDTWKSGVRCRNSGWLSMMYPRLRVAYDLLRPGGYMFISICDAEIHNLVLMLNEIFGELGRIGTLVRRRSMANNCHNKIATVHEYIVCYYKGDALESPFVHGLGISSRDKLPITGWIDGPLNAVGTKELQELMGGKYFDYPKPIGLVCQLISATTTSDDIILDFFAGSGTTGHAVMQQNAEDGGRRRFILVQRAEQVIRPLHWAKCYNTIVEITRDRLILAGQKISALVQDGMFKCNLDVGFKYFRVNHELCN